MGENEIRKEMGTKVISSYLDIFVLVFDQNILIAIVVRVTSLQ